MIKDRYTRNRNALSESENNLLRQFRVCVVGCGGLGGYVIEYLGRLGIGKITAIDGDVFDASNLNRQLLSEEALLGTGKALAAAARMAKVNSEIVLTPLSVFLTGQNAEELLSGHDLVVDALDNIQTRRLLEKTCSDLCIPLVHGAIGGWYGQVTTIFPGENVLDQLYPPGDGAGIESDLGNPPFTPALIASIEACEVVKVLLGKEDILRGKLLTIDLLHHVYEVFDF